MKNKFAILSHILPPSDSGQAVILYRLLEKIPKNQYILISNKNYENIQGEPKSTRKLSAKYFILNPEIKNNFLIQALMFVPILNHIVRLCNLLKVRSRELEKILNKEKIKTLIVCTGDLYDLPVAYLACKKYKTKFVVYLFDDYVYQWTGINRKMARFFAWFIFRKTNNLIVPNEFLQKEYFYRYKKKALVVHNPYLPDESNRKLKLFDRREINILFTGTVYSANFDAFRNLVLAMEYVKNPVKLHIFTSQPREMLKNEGIINEQVKIYKNVSQGLAIAYQKQADILFLPLAFESPIPEVIKTSAPGKTAEYLASGRPILVHAPKDSFLTWYFKKKKAGMVIDELSPSKLAWAILKIINDKNYTKLMIKNAKNALNDFSVERARKNFKKIIN